LVYRYVLESPDRSPQELKTIEDWVLERAYRSVPGVADDSGFGGTVMQYQVLLDPARLYGYHLTVQQVMTALAANNANAGGGFYSQGGQFYYVRGLGLVQTTKDIDNIVIAANKGTPIRVRDVGDVTIGHAPRLGEFGFQTHAFNHDDAVEGVILMRRNEQAQDVLKGVQNKTEELNRAILPKDVKIVPYYDRSDLVKLTTTTVEDNLLRGMVLVVVVLLFFLVSIRAAVIVAQPFRWRCCFPSLCCMPAASPPTCFPSAPLTSGSSLTAPWSWWKTFSANCHCGTDRSTSSLT